jgi:hydroxyacylglutathione hydrolase
MALEIVTVPCLRDNYAYLLRDGASGTVALVDAPEAAPILAALADRGWDLDLVLLTHHHDDPVAGLGALCQAHRARVMGALADRERLPRLDVALTPGDTVAVGEEIGRVLDVPGHTVGHIAFHFPQSRALFTGDSLMALGCGRLFEGTPAQMWGSLSHMAALPGETQVYSGHEYIQSNARFALSLDPQNEALQARAREIDARRAEGRPCVPVSLATELATNPFLRPDDPSLRQRLDMAEAADVEVFAEIRRRKDAF